MLVVDDEPGICKALVRTLRSHEVVTMPSAQDAMDLLARDTAFDAILCDLMMPGLSGMDLHRWLVDSHPAMSVRLCFMTGGAFTPAARDYLAHVDVVVIDKPFDARRVVQIVNERVVAAR